MLGSLALLAASFSVSDAPIELNGMLCHPSRLLVKIRPGHEAIEAERYGVSLLRNFREIRWASFEVTPGNLQATKAKLEKDPVVEMVAFDRAALPAFTPNDALYGGMWHVGATNTNLAWNISLGGTPVTVAVIDTGVKTNHPDLINKLWSNTLENPTNGIDDDGNGYVDDKYGYDFAYGDGTPDDVHGHGTACAGIVGAQMHNSIGGCGMAMRARIMSLKAATNAGYFYDTANIGAYLYAANMGARILSCSFFSDRVSQPEEDALAYCLDHNVLPMVAAGNSNSTTVYYPGSYEQVVGVAAMDQSLGKAGFSNFGTWVDVATPGTAIVATNNSGGYTTGFAGTSAACPVAAGIAALILSTRPALTNEALRAILEDTCMPGTDTYTNYGRIDANAAMLAAIVGPVTGKSARFAYMTPAVTTATKKVRVYGRGFQTPRVVRVRAGGVILNIRKQTRDFVDVDLPAGNAQVDVTVNGQMIANFARPTAGFNTFPLTEGSPSAGTGLLKFDECLNLDNKYSTVIPNGGNVTVDGLFRGVEPAAANMTLRIIRGYLFGGGNEKIYLYNWSTASYPYGSFDLVSNGAAPVSQTQKLITVASAANYIDPEGVVIMRIVSTGLPPAAQFKLGLCHLRD